MLRIVIFDDEERIGLQLKELLEQSGDDLVVDFFQDWHALQFYFSQHAHIDAVFMDICFQGSTSSGIDFAEKIAQSHSQTKFIYVTGHPREYLQQIFMSKTVNPFGYLPKPFDRKAVQDYLQKIRAASADSQDLSLSNRKRDRWSTSLCGKCCIFPATDAASQHTPFTVPMRATTSFPSSWRACRSTFISAIKVMLSICTMYSELTPRKYIFRRRSFRSVHMGTALLQKIGQSWCNVKANCINRKTYGNTAQRSPIENG